MKADVVKNRECDAYFGSENPATLYLVLFFTVPSGAVGSAAGEVSGHGYSRTAIPNDLTNFPAAVAGVKSNGVSHEGPVAASDYADTVKAYGYATGSSGNNLVAYITKKADGTDITPVPVSATQKVVVNPGTSTFSIIDTQ